MTAGTRLQNVRTNPKCGDAIDATTLKQEVLTWFTNPSPWDSKLLHNRYAFVYLHIDRSRVKCVSYNLLKSIWKAAHATTEMLAA